MDIIRELYKNLVNVPFNSTINAIINAEQI